MARATAKHKTLRGMGDASDLHASRAGRVLATIRRDMDLKDDLMRRRRRNEEILALEYEENVGPGGGSQDENLRSNVKNLPYRYQRWFESQLTSKKLVVKVDRNAGAGQRPGGPGDEQTGMWLSIALQRLAYIAGYEREIKAVAGEVLPRGTSVIKIGYHRDEVALTEAHEVGKDAQSVAPEVMAKGDIFAKPGQAHDEIAEGLLAQADDPIVQLRGGQNTVDLLLARRDSHLEAAKERELDDKPISGTRLIRHRIFMRKLRVGEDVGWSPHVYDVEDASFWWERHVWTVAEVKASPLFSDAFKRVVEGYDARNLSGVARGGKTPSTDSMGTDAKQAQGEDVLEDDEKFVEWFACWYRRPDMRSGGIRKIVAPEYPDDFVEADDSNPHVDEKGFGLIEGFYPFYDFTPFLPSKTTPERTCGIPPIAVGMPQVERISEFNRLRTESARRHSLRMYQLHPGLKDDKDTLNAIRDAKDGYAFVVPASLIDAQGNMMDAVRPIQFTGNTQEIDRQAAREEGDWVQVMGMPPAVLQGVGTGETLGQEQIGVAAGERESQALVEYFEKRLADVLKGIRGLARGLLDDEDWVEMLGAQGAQVIKAWQIGSSDEGDQIIVTSGARAYAQETVDRKQLMEAITLERGEVEPLTGLPKYDSTDLFEELHRRLDVGPPKPNTGVIGTLQQMVVTLAGQLQQLQGAMGMGQPQKDGGGQRPPSGGGPNPSEGNGPSTQNLSAGAKRDTLPSEPMKDGRLAGVVPAARSG